MRKSKHSVLRLLRILRPIRNEVFFSVDSVSELHVLCGYRILRSVKSIRRTSSA